MAKIHLSSQYLYDLQVVTFILGGNLIHILNFIIQILTTSVLASSISTVWDTKQYNVSSAPLGSSAPGPQCNDCYGQHYGSVLYQQIGRDSFVFPNMEGLIPIPSYV